MVEEQVLDFRDNPNPASRTKKTIKKPVAAPRTKIEQTDKALKNYTVF